MTHPVRPSLVHSIDLDIGQPMVCDDSANGQSLRFETVDGRQLVTYSCQTAGVTCQVTLSDAEAAELTAWRNNGRRTSYWDWSGWDAVKARAHPVST